VHVLDSTATDKESTELATASDEILLLWLLLFDVGLFAKFIIDQCGVLEEEGADENAILAELFVIKLTHLLDRHMKEYDMFAPLHRNFQSNASAQNNVFFCTI